jgi:nucleotide-binding universal stress UspA family protein
MSHLDAGARMERMSRQILLLTDFSADSERAFAPAAQFADLLGARITLLHVVETAIAPQAGPPSAPFAASAAGALAEREAEARRRLLELAARFPRVCEVKTALTRGPDAATAAAAFAEKNGVDLIAMASHGRTGLRRLVMGSVAESLLRRASVPVLVFPAASARPARTAAEAAGG